MKSGATAIAYETVTRNGSLPLLTPMSEVAGRMSIQVGAACLQKANGGYGVLLGGVPGVPPAKVVILGGGVSGTHAAEMAVGMRADVTVVDRSVDRLRELSSLFGASLRTAYSTAGDDRAPGARCRSRRRRGAGRRRRGTEARDPRHGREHAAGHRAGRHLDRPGRMLRDQQADHARGSRRSWWMVSCTTAWPTCRARLRAPPRSR